MVLKVIFEKYLLIPGINFSFLSLMVVHQQLNTTYIPWLFRGSHLAHQIIHPQYKVAHHGKESGNILVESKLHQFRQCLNGLSKSIKL
jgi:hypothetical protein